MEKNIEFKLQNLILHSDRLPEEHSAMMYRGARMVYVPMKSAFFLNPGEFTEFFTYFNSISYAKWKKYTHAGEIFLRLRCKGDFTVQLIGHYDGGADIKKEFLKLNYFNLKEMTDIEIPVPSDAKGQVIGFQIQVGPKKEDAAIDGKREQERKNGEEDQRFWIEGGYWFTRIPKSRMNPVNISIVTTTFLKEEYIRRNVDILERELFYGGEACRERFRLRIVDNGRTLEQEDFDSEFVTLYPNPNVGGSGGFTRGMIESLHDDKFKATHVLLMDDDVIIFPEALIRTYTMLAIMKLEFSEYFISGAMLKEQQMDEQHEDIAYFHKNGYCTPLKQVLSLHLWNHVFLNEKEYTQMPNSYCGWWYCCIPVKIIGKDDLPFPIFVRGDDIDYGVRHHANIITLSGIFVWHSDFNYKFSASMEFYMVNRNALITQAADGIFPEADIIGRIDKWFWQRIKSLDYLGCDLLLDAIEDYLKGPDFLMFPKGEQIMKEKAAKNEKMDDLYSVCSGLEGIEESNVLDGLYDHEELRGIKKFFYNLTCNGHIMPKCFLKKNIAVIPFDWFWFDGPKKQYMCKKVLAVNIYGRSAHIRERSRRRFLALIKRRKHLMRQYKKRQVEVVEKYRIAGETFKTEKFWRKYLGI